MRVLLRHAGLWGHARITPALLLLRQVILIGYLLRVDGEVVGVHRRRLHARPALLGGEVLWCWFFGRLDGVLVVDAVLVVAGWLWSVEAGLNVILVTGQFVVAYERAHTWMRFLPSALVTRG